MDPDSNPDRDEDEDEDRAPLPPFREVPLTEAAVEELGIYASQGLRLLSITSEPDSPETIVAAIHDYIDAWDDSLVGTDRELMAVALCLGLVWGHLVTITIDWEWAALEMKETGPTTYAVVSPDRAYAIHPGPLVGEYLK
ncbi:MAG: hypothetical protein V4671_00585, partial [Armatimonadota bacterium]